MSRQDRRGRQAWIPPVKVKGPSRSEQDGAPLNRRAGGLAKAPFPADRRGFGLATALLWTLLLASLALALHLRVSNQMLSTSDAERQLYSFVLAENGVEYARTILPHLDLNSLLVGENGRHEGDQRPEWRNPVPYRQAQSADVDQLRADGDDGLPFGAGALPPGGYRAEGGLFLLRFSNNPEEPRDLDSDKVILVRSLGVVPGLLPDPAAGDVRNAVTLVEARFRKETVFDLPAALALSGDSGDFQLDGSSFTVDGGDRIGVAVVAVAAAGLLEDFLDALSPSQRDRVRGAGAIPSVRDVSADYRDDENRRSVFEASFWRHFEESLPEFSDLPDDGLRFLPEGGAMRQSYRGALVVRGEFRMLGEARIEGLLLHLGGGALRLRDRASVVGGVWMSNLDHSGDAVAARPIQLEIADNALIQRDEQAVRWALGRFPPTQLGWRVLFPEMLQ